MILNVTDHQQIDDVALSQMSSHKNIHAKTKFYAQMMNDTPANKAHCWVQNFSEKQQEDVFAFGFA